MGRLGCRIKLLWFLARGRLGGGTGECGEWEGLVLGLWVGWGEAQGADECLWSFVLWSLAPTPHRPKTNLPFSGHFPTATQSPPAHFHAPPPTTPTGLQGGQRGSVGSRIPVAGSCREACAALSLRVDSCREACAALSLRVDRKRAPLHWSVQ